MDVVNFIYYKPSHNTVFPYTLRNPRTDKAGKYLHGFSPFGGGYKTFRCDRVIEYFESYEDAVRAKEGIEGVIKELGYDLDALKDKHSGVKKFKRYESPAMYQPIDFSGPLEICFTGFLKEDKERLINTALDAGMVVRKNVTVNLHFLCGGFNAGPKKLEVAQKKGTIILREPQFLSFVSTGELPDDYGDH